MINFSDPQIWVAISFILFFVLFGNIVWKNFSKFLDNKIENISNEIKSANNLHKEAKDLLSEETKKFQSIDNEIKIILEEGKLQSQNLFNANKSKINAEIEKLEKSSIEKLNYLEQQAIEDMKKKIISKAIKLTESFLIKNLNDNNHLQFMHNSINETDKTLAGKDKFIQ